MGKIDLGILGAVHGKVGPVIGQTWKGIPFLKGYFKPSNPNTAAQQAQRLKMTRMVATAQEFISDLIPALWNPVAVKMSGYNYFVKTNINLLDATDYMDADCLSSKGTLEGTSIVLATYNSGTGVGTVEWDITPTGNGLDTDLMYVVVWDKSSKIGYAFSPSETRADETIDVALPAGLTATNLRLYLSCYRGSGSSFEVSDSVNAVCSAP